MKHPLRKTTYADAAAHAEDVLACLVETEEYDAVTARAETLGVTITTSLRHTYTEEFVASYKADPTAEGNLPAGYAMELWFDVVKDGRVLLTGEDQLVQCSYGAPVIDYTGVLFFCGFRFHALDYVLERNPICAMLEEFLDQIEETGYKPSPFTIRATGEIPDAVGVLTRSEVASGTYVEFSVGDYDGTVGAETSLYLPAEESMPYRLFLHGVTGEKCGFEGESLTLDEEVCDELVDLLEDMPSTLRAAASFTDIFMAVCESPLAPPPHTEQVLDALTVCRPEAFLADCEKIAAFLRDALENEQVVTVIW